MFLKLGNNPRYEREKSAKIWRDISFCCHCLIVMARRFWFSHVKRCQKNSCKKILPVPVGLLNDEVRISDGFLV